MKIIDVQHLPGCTLPLHWPLPNFGHHFYVASKLKVSTWKLSFTANGAGSLPSCSSIHPGCVSGYLFQSLQFVTSET